MRKNFFRRIATTLAVALAVMLGVCASKTLSVKATNDTVDRTFFYSQELQGKSIVFYGDSITARHGLLSTEKDYMQILQEEFGFYYSNMAVGGATWSVEETSTNHVFTQMSRSEALYRDADCVSIFLGTNDFGLGRELGTTDDRDRKDTILGAMRSALNTIISANPDVKIMLVTELNRYDFEDFDATDDSLTNSAGATINEHRNAVKLIAEQYGCSLVDLSTLVTPANRLVYLNADKLHVTELGYYAIANALKNAGNVEETASRAFSYTEDLQGKSIVFYGDSITARLGLKKEDKDYMQFLQNEFEFYYSNQAVSDATWTETSSSTNHVFTQLSKSTALYRDADCVSIFLGTNDFGANREIGSPTDETTNTVYGAIRTTLDTILAVNPDVKIMLLTPINRYDLSSTANQLGYTLNDYRVAIARMAIEYGCTLADLSEVVTSENYTTLLNSDKLHVVETGYQAIANALKTA